MPKFLCYSGDSHVDCESRSRDPIVNEKPADEANKLLTPQDRIRKIQ